jgi:hypothetical protein
MDGCWRVLGGRPDPAGVGISGGPMAARPMTATERRNAVAVFFVVCAGTLGLLFLPIILMAWASH